MCVCAMSVCVWSACVGWVCVDGMYVVCVCVCDAYDYVGVVGVCSVLMCEVGVYVCSW